MTDRDTEQVDDLLGMRPNEVSAQDPIGVLFDQRLEAVDRFVEPPSRVPIRNLLRMYPKFEPPRARVSLA